MFFKKLTNSLFIQYKKSPITFTFTFSQLCNQRHVSRNCSKMPKSKVKEWTEAPGNVKTEQFSSPVVHDQHKKSIFIHILAKPGAKHNNITGIDSDGIGVQIAAPPVDGEANAELLKFFSKILGVRKSTIQLEKGSKSRIKVISVQNDSALSVEDILGKIQSQIS